MLIVYMDLDSDCLVSIGYVISKEFKNLLAIDFCQSSSTKEKNLIIKYGIFNRSTLRLCLGVSEINLNGVVSYRVIEICLNRPNQDVSCAI